MKTMTKEQLQAIRERAEKATPGPWTPCVRTMHRPSYGCAGVGQITKVMQSLWHDVEIAGKAITIRITEQHYQDITWDAIPFIECGESGMCKGRKLRDYPISLDIHPDADFIAHARQDVPDLLAYIEQLEAMVDASGDYDMGAVCRNCGETYGQHIGYECAKDGGTFLPAPPAPTSNEKETL